MLARIDGKSPVEYITEDACRDLVRATAARVILDGLDRLEPVFCEVERSLHPAAVR
jgi:hypothetical protein